MPIVPVVHALSGMRNISKSIESYNVMNVSSLNEVKAIGSHFPEAGHLISTPEFRDFQHSLFDSYQAMYPVVQIGQQDLVSAFTLGTRDFSVTPSQEHVVLDRARTNWIRDVVPETQEFIKGTIDKLSNRYISLEGAEGIYKELHMDLAEQHIGLLNTVQHVEKTEFGSGRQVVGVLEQALATTSDSMYTALNEAEMALQLNSEPRPRADFVRGYLAELEPQLPPPSDLAAIFRRIGEAQNHAQNVDGDWMA